MPIEIFMTLPNGVGNIEESHFLYNYSNLFKITGELYKFSYEKALNKLTEYGDEKMRLKVLFLYRMMRHYAYFLSQPYDIDIGLDNKFLENISKISDPNSYINFVKEFFQKQNWIMNKEIFQTYIDLIFVCINEAPKYKVQSNDSLGDKFSITNYDNAIRLLDLENDLIVLLKKAVYDADVPGDDDNNLKISSKYLSSHILGVDIGGISSGEKAMVQFFSCMNSAKKNVR